MKKINVLWAILDSIFLIIFNVFFFVLRGSNDDTSITNISVWISFGFIHFAYLMLLLTPFLVRKGKNTAVFGFSLFSVSAGYFLIEFVTGIIFIIFSPESYTAALLVQISIAGLYGIILISNMIANEHTADAEEKRQCQIDNIKEASLKLKLLLDSISDQEIKKMIEKVYDEVYSSPVKSHPSIAQIESRILQSINELENEASADNKEKILPLTNSLLAAVNERNRRLKTLN